MLGCLLISNCKANTHCVAERWISNSGLRDRRFVWISVSLSLCLSLFIFLGITCVVPFSPLSSTPAIDWQRTGCCVTHGRLLVEVLMPGPVPSVPVLCVSNPGAHYAVQTVVPVQINPWEVTTIRPLVSLCASVHLACGYTWWGAAHSV